MQVLKASLNHKAVLENLMQPYLHDMSEFTGDLPDTNGKYSLGEYFDLYWSQVDRYPYLLIDDANVVGFALVRKLSPTTYAMAEFFVLRSCRKLGLAKRFAIEIFQRHTGEWRVAELEKNIPAQGFWRNVIDQISNGDYTEGWSGSYPKGPVQVFRNE